MVRFPKAYTMVIDEQVKAMAIKDISTCGADEFVAKACVRLDCSRIKDDMRMMQTIGTPYKYEVTRTLIGIDYALQQGWIDENKKDEYVSKLVALHKRNLKYEEDNFVSSCYPVCGDMQGAALGSRLQVCIGNILRVCHKSMAHPLLCYLLYNPRSIVAYSKKGII